MSTTDILYPIPAWATGTTTDYLAVGAQLCTRDGRKCGNAVTTSVDTRNGCKVAVVVTDIGTKMHLTESEIQELFYPPEWLMNVEKHSGAMKAYTSIAFTDAQLKRLWNNSPQIAKDVKSCEGFKRVVRLAESAHGMEMKL